MFSQDSVTRSVKNSGNSCLYSPRLLVNRFLANDANTVVNAICDSLRRGNSWDVLSRNFDSVELNDLLVKNVLLELKEPTDAKRALGFFHWSAQRKNFVHEAYAKLRLFEVGFEVCCYLADHGFFVSLTSFNILIHVVQKSDKSPWILEEGKIEVAMALLKLMLQKNMILDAIAYSLIVYAKVRLGNLDSAMEVYEEMLKRGFIANSFVYTSFIGAYCNGGKLEEANQLIEEMENMGLKPYDETYNFLIEGCAKSGRVEESLSYCEKMIERGLLPSRLAFNKMVTKLCETGAVKQANAMLTRLLDNGFLPNDITYSHLIAGYARDNQIQEVLKLYYEMEYRALCPGLLAFTSLIRILVIVES
ncbi:hypothetical protein GH714_008633 [Hevea brasiliensis]|uniref:Pentacotripeptide-repeat region of PRORP domain-containing protein n=1 Tax=Hevea brasiliensis TaxID=3981 RepID=A0A6A6MKW1_HEVBR|nr:hypothetical protein GH714_008633 [Hevea brasiliensis]